MAKASITESSSFGKPDKIDRENNVIRGVKILGLESANGRVYPKAVIERALSQYEGRRVFVDHVSPDNPKRARSYSEQIGVIRKPVMRDDGAYGDFHYNPKHPQSEQMLYDAEKNPDARLFQSVPDQVPFLSEADAVAHALKAHADTFFSAETVEVEPPKGAFTAIARCGFTGEFLAPPNYHGYQKTLREHFAGKIGEQHMPFERFLSRVETVKDEAAVAAWLESKKKLVRYTLKDRAEGEPEHFESLEAVKAHLLASRKDKLVKALPFVRLSGKDIEKLPAGAIRASIEHEITFQRKFPLDTANAIRGRLRKAGFSLYKRGAKGVTYLCGVKRKFRTPATPPFSDDIQRVFDHIERTQDVANGRYVRLPELPEALLGIKPAPAPEPAAEGEAPAAPAEAPAPAHSPEDTAKLAMLAQNIRWLVTEGYVTEFSDGRLFALPVMSEAQAKAAAAEEESHAKPAKPAGEAPSAELPLEAPEEPEA